MCGFEIASLSPQKHKIHKKKKKTTKKKRARKKKKKRHRHTEGWGSFPHMSRVAISPVGGTYLTKYEMKLLLLLLLLKRIKKKKNERCDHAHGENSIRN